MNHSMESVIRTQLALPTFVTSTPLTPCPHVSSSQNQYSHPQMCPTGGYLKATMQIQSQHISLTARLQSAVGMSWEPILRDQVDAKMYKMRLYFLSTVGTQDAFFIVDDRRTRTRHTWKKSQWLSTQLRLLGAHPTSVVLKPERSQTQNINLFPCPYHCWISTGRLRSDFLTPYYLFPLLHCYN